LKSDVALGCKLGQRVMLPMCKVWGFSLVGHFPNLPVDNFLDGLSWFWYQLWLHGSVTGNPI
jgi:hypothetical protein